MASLQHLTSPALPLFPLTKTLPHSSYFPRMISHSSNILFPLSLYKHAPNSSVFLPYCSPPLNHHQSLDLEGEEEEDFGEIEEEFDEDEDEDENFLLDVDALEKDAMSAVKEYSSSLSRELVIGELYHTWLGII